MTATTATLTYGQQITLDTLRDFGPYAVTGLAEHVLDCDPTPAEDHAAKTIAEELVTLGLATITDGIITAN